MPEFDSREQGMMIGAEDSAAAVIPEFIQASDLNPSDPIVYSSIKHMVQQQSDRAMERMPEPGRSLGWNQSPFR